MRKLIAAAVAVFVVACSSSSNPSGSASKAAADSTKPEILIEQTSSVPVAARHTDGALPVHYALRVANRALEPITLKQVSVQSVSVGAYSVAPTSKPFDVRIDAQQKQDVEFWVSGLPSGSIVGANGPVTLRVTCFFENAAGEKFQEIVMRRVNERASITGMQ